MLAEIIQKGKCIAFIGSGLSKAESYRDWEEVIKGKNGLIDFVFENQNLYLIDVEKKLIDLVEDCKNHNFDRYKEFILNEFGRKFAPFVYHPNHQQIWKIPFHSVFTTNFDPCLYDAGRSLDVLTQVFSYPYFPIPPQKSSLNHLHGLAFYTGDDDIDLIDTIIFSKSEYANAYKGPNNYLKDLLFFSMTKYTIFFSGFSLKDPFILDLFKDINQNINYRAELVKLKLKENIILPSHFILFPEGEPDEELLADLNALNINVISYKPINTNYVGLDYILQYLSTGKSESFVKMPSIKGSIKSGENNES
ncbi:MAG TPA: SIR2 family protein [Ignavibacteriaceae bacterium]|nr:SIR2 family protein [Ignavibacteriaceae bacterium]